MLAIQGQSLLPSSKPPLLGVSPPDEPRIRMENASAIG
jgi:hypothetical protein